MTTPQHLSDRYELGEILGFGGMSEVHLARDTRLHRDVAVKVLRADLARDPSFYLRFRREAQNAAALNHPAIVAVYDTGEAETPNGPLPYIVMEYVDGVTLRDIVHSEGPIPPRRAIEIIADACQALNFSHQHGIVHRDVKPANIMISKNNAVKVMDFGIARALADTGNSVTQTAAVIGTAQYLSPEQARGETVDARSDVYSLGCVLYEILTGEPPFIGDSPVAVAYQHVREDPIPPSHRHTGISPELDAVVLKALAKNPDNRYQTAAEMRTDLIRVHSGEAPEAPKVLTDAERTSMMNSGPMLAQGGGAPTQNMVVPRPADRNTSVARWLIAVAVLAVLTVVVTVAINMIGGNPRDVQVPDVSGQRSADAVAALQNRGFKTRTEPQTDNKVPPGVVIGTDPAANSMLAAGDEITVNVSQGPQQAQIPDVAGLTPSQARQKLKDAGFEKVKETPSPSTPEQKGRVLATNPPANQTAGIIYEVTLVVGSGPENTAVPDCGGQSVDVCKQILTASGFASTVVIEVDNTAPAGQVVGTEPAAGASVPKDTPVQIHVSKGNQFVMPNLVGQFWDDVYPRLTALGWTGVLDKGPDVRDSGQRTNAVVTQSPPAGTGVNRDARITLSFAS
ncbi:MULTISPECIES: Stk1 family PASTA domain-containing Ser/Thr kinase [Mycolicibacterium]|uniref:Serine/threonine-protein kinase PknB n=1 Tax=Mycolicibacterium conceptionense TaxID=451644 RepID=A0A0U1CWF1_9MYCO|nr:MULTISPECIES: Stk1 family PASTA domain-containing Ser/Thr kinase [Mycolicibacterium]MCV7337396.1 Stk1 family PASTA domain-containing Ser/Thr kinase [Mycolicibacterium senegalense]MCW1824001.1 Stk1 family PASTA domain-containing Ser/Thr kinase [Mycolicibacterium senegalense]OBB12976.1 serine/threonine protein kinase [Mycolicibacterium conceptionense]OBF06255.1 serine/threonine protein kinase [Mycolicibacterium conceptionense]OBF25714.1 serine/threonine protein kinase [Mycolicibacterium conce